MMQDWVSKWLPLVTRIFVPGWLSVTTGFLQFRPVIIGYHFLNEAGVTAYHRLPTQPKSSGYRLPVSLFLPGYQRLPKNKNFLVTG